MKLFFLLKGYYAKRRSVVKFFFSFANFIFWIFESSRFFKNLKAHVLSFFREPIYSNCMYGIGFILKRYSRFEGFHMAYIEHGFFYHSISDEFVWCSDSFVVFSSERKDRLKPLVNKTILSIGPYIHYAVESDSLLSTEESLIMNKNLDGINILVFPSHSTNDFVVSNPVDDLINLLNNIGLNNSVNSVSVCLHPKDYCQVDVRERWLHSGYYIFTIGDVYSSYFLDRLKTILLRMDVVITNAIGTHVAYADYLSVPVGFVDCRARGSFISGKRSREFIDKSIFVDVFEYEELLIEKFTITRMLQDNFVFDDNFRSATLKHDVEVSYIFGYNDIKSSEELYNFFRLSIL